MKMVVVLTIICVFSALLLGVTYNLTIKNIQLQMVNAEKESLKSVLPDAKDFSQKISGKAIEYYKGFDEANSIVGYAFIGEGKGYSGPIVIMIGVDKNLDIKGIKILSQRETPGLGSRVEEVSGGGTIWDLFKGKRVEKSNEPWFQKQFREKSIDKVDTITGATITSRAVIDAVKDAVEKFKKEELKV
jgi:electron transport complex protein RnfG